VQPDTTDLPELPQGWGWASVEQLSEVLSGFAYKSTDFCSEGVPVTKIANIGYGVYELDTAQEFLPSIFLKDTSDFIVSEGVVLIALTRPITNGTLKSCLYPNHLPVSLLNQRVAALKVISPVLADYFYLLTRTPYFREQVRTSTSETLQPNMSPNALKVISLPLPSLCEAQKLVELTNAQLTEVGNQEIAINISIKQSTAQRQNILRAAFAGQLVPQDPNDEPASVLLERIRAERAALYASRTRRSINRAKAEKS
jgi:type I restriction enzyme S subunit